MIGDPVVAVVCDSCGYEEEHGLTPLARKAWDMRDLKFDLERSGWRIEGDNTYCPECVEEEKDRAAEKAEQEEREEEEERDGA